MEKNQKLLAAGAAFLLTAGLAVGTYLYRKSSSASARSEPEESKTPDPIEEQEESKQEVAAAANWAGWTDPSYDTNMYLSKVEAQSRSKVVSDVSYLLTIGLVKGGKTFHGKVTIEYMLSRTSPDWTEGGDNSQCLFIDYKGKHIKSMIVNGKDLAVDAENIWHNHRIYVPNKHQKVGVNRAVIEFETIYVTDCQGFQYFKDDADGSEYVYTELEPDYCHIVFPCFDQPDLKASHKSCVIAPADWEVITNSEEINQTDALQVTTDDKEFKAALKRFEVPADSPILSSFEDTQIKLHEFERTKKISTYLFSFVAGPFDCLHPSDERASEEPRIPMRLYCRKSLTKYAEKMKDDWFRVTKASIRFYEQMFDTPYPFDKLDSIMCPDYAMGAMENVGCITYNDDYVQRDENFTRYKQENIFNTIAHEISHQWFGNLVTMKWWDDLWLNESFANMISYMAMDEAQGLEDLTLAWNIFIDEQYGGLSEDQKNTTHPIAADVVHTGVAQDIFDGISYGKGAAFLHQMVFYLGKDILKEGLKTYFAKYKFKNTELSDFIAELSDAAQRLGLTVDFQQWSDSWLTSPGCAEIDLLFEKDAAGVCSNLRIKQTPYNQANTPTNKLRVQAFNVASLDENMQVMEVVRVETSASQAETPIEGFANQDKRIHAFVINHGAHGYGKFGIDEMTLKALESGLHKISSSLDRKQLLNQMYDLIKSGSLPAYRVLNIILNNFEHETAVDVLQDTFRFVVPCILSKFLHVEVHEEGSQEMFDLTLKLMQSGRFNEFPAAMETLVSSAISFATTKDHEELVHAWFAKGQATDKRGQPIQGGSINVKLRHTIVRKLFASKHLQPEAKKECFAALAKLDQSDMLGRTEKYCFAADPNPKSKREAFLTIFEGSDEMSLLHVQEMCRGFRQFSQREMIETFSDEYFERIEDCINKRAWSLTRYIYLFLAPSMNANDVELTRFQKLLSKLESYTEAERTDGTARLINWVKDSIQEIEEKKQGRELSRMYQQEQD